MATSSSDPARKAVEVAASDPDKNVTLHRMTVRADLPLPGGKKASLEVSHEAVRITKDKR